MKIPNFSVTYLMDAPREKRKEKNFPPPGQGRIEGRIEGTSEGERSAVRGPRRKREKSEESKVGLVLKKVRSVVQKDRKGEES